MHGKTVKLDGLQSSRSSARWIVCFVRKGGYKLTEVAGAIFPGLLGCLKRAINFPHHNPARQNFSGCCLVKPTAALWCTALPEWWTAQGHLHRHENWTDLCQYFVVVMKSCGEKSHLDTVVGLFGYKEKTTTTHFWGMIRINTAWENSDHISRWSQLKQWHDLPRVCLSLRSEPALEKAEIFPCLTGVVREK